jgi:hypothetical protein
MSMAADRDDWDIAGWRVMSGERAISAATTTAVLVVAAIAAVVSFVHIEDLALAHGQRHFAAVLLPLSIDGTVAAASLVMLRAAQGGLPTPSLARLMLVLSVAATLAANVGYGLPFGVAGALISGWPAIAFVGSVEMVIGMVRRTRQGQHAPQVLRSWPDAREWGDDDPEVGDDRREMSDAVVLPMHSGVEGVDEDRARAALAESVRRGNPLSGRALQREFGLSRKVATALRDELVGKTNGGDTGLSGEE